MTFIESQADRVTVDGLRWGVEPICRVLTEHRTPIAPSSHYDHKAAPAIAARAARTDRDAAGAGRCRTLHRRGLDAPSGDAGARRGKVKTTTVADPHAVRPDDPVERDFDPDAPDQLWAADSTSVLTWSGWVSVSFMSDASARRILGWRCSPRVTTPLILDAIEQAIETRERDGVTDLTGLIYDNDRRGEYASIAFTERLLEATRRIETGQTASYSQA